MKEGLEEKIRSVGHWRVNIRPAQPVETKLLLKQAADLVEKCSVSLRGWDYPHFNRNDKFGGHELVNEYVQNWCDWEGHIEFWRMYRSTQFIHYRVLWEDTNIIVSNKPTYKHLSVISGIYSMTEIVEFTSRLFRAGLYQSGANLNVSIRNTKGRQLWVSDPMRMPFHDDKRTEAEEISIERNISPESLAETPKEVSIDMLLELFDQFGWNPDPSVIRRDQTRFYDKQFWNGVTQR